MDIATLLGNRGDRHVKCPKNVDQGLNMNVDKAELRKKDPIGQILDSLCNASKEKEGKKKEKGGEKDMSDETSAFTPFSKATNINKSSLFAQSTSAITENNFPQNFPFPIPNSCFSKFGLEAPQGSLDPSMMSPQSNAIMPHQFYPLPVQRSLQSMVTGSFPVVFPNFPGNIPQNIPNCFSLGSFPYFGNMDPCSRTDLGTYALNLKTSGNPNFDLMSKTVKTQFLTAVPPRYQCEDCKKSYSTYGGLTKHKQFHCATQLKKEFSCKYCGKSYGSLGALKMHIRTHTLPCKCKVCGKAFSRPWLLQGHMRTHTGEKPFSCLHCARAFADRSNLRAHLQTHSDVKKYGCKSCSKTFSRMSLLVKHRENNNCI